MENNATRIIQFPAEVIGLIFDQVEAWVEVKGRDKSLADFANLARSCHTFREPALNRLWKVQGNLTRLIRCMPEDLWKITVDENGKEVELTFRREIAETDWTRFEYYQWRVQEFGITHDILRTRLDTYDVHPDVLRALTTYRPTKVFLPNLQRWMVNDKAKELLPFVDAFIGPELRHAFMSLTGSPPDTMHISTLLWSLVRSSVDLQSLEFVYGGHDNLYGPLFNLVTQLPNLRHLVISNMCSKFLDHLSRLPFLEVLSQVKLQGEEDIPLFITQDGRFPSLRVINIGVSDYTTACALLKVLQRPLESVTLQVSENSPVDTPTRLTHFTQALSMLKQYHCVSLKELGIYLPSCRTSASEQLTSDAFAPLYSFQSLQNLILATPFSLHLDDIWLAHAVTFWPALKAFRIQNRCKTTQELPGFTLKGLIPMMKGCPQLSELGLPLNLKPVAVSSLEGASNWHIRHIRVTHGSTVDQPRRVFRSLVAMFPNLISLILPDRAPNPGAKWKELLELFRTLRPAQEKHEQQN